MPTHAVFLCLIYPVIGLVLARAILGYDILPLLFPLAAGFALVGPFAARFANSGMGEPASPLMLATGFGGVVETG